MSTLQVELNGDGVHSIAAPDRFAAQGSFSIALVNRGQASHVHLNLDDTLAEVATLAATNHYVESEGVTHVQVTAAEPDDTVRGKLKVVVGHGAATEYVTLAVEPRPRNEQPVIVDESLSSPPEREPEPTPAEALAAAVDEHLTGERVTAVAVVAVALVVAVAVALAVDSPLVQAGAAVVVLAAAAASYLAVR
ncbi:hypothetical protein GCM10027435_15850 [Haloparvum alkalitolerans]|uniref:DUF7524 family protein n=1 Tax=Haloparvum alkalitolerans TaxID=1042953 RepID=UPI003CE719A6